MNSQRTAFEKACGDMVELGYDLDLGRYCSSDANLAFEVWQAATEQGEPVGYLVVDHFRDNPAMQNVDYEHADVALPPGRHKLYTRQPPAEQGVGEPVAWWNGESRFTRHPDMPGKHYWEKVIPLYTYLPKKQDMTETHWSAKNPGLADQYRAEALRCRNLLGFSASSENVSPSDLGKAIIDLTGSTKPTGGGVPDIKQIVIAAMQDTWDDWVGDTDSLPPDVEVHGPRTTRVSFQASTWADNVGRAVEHRLATQQPPEQ